MARNQFAVTDIADKLVTRTVANDEWHEECIRAARQVFGYKILLRTYTKLFITQYYTLNRFRNNIMFAMEAKKSSFSKDGIFNQFPKCLMTIVAVYGRAIVTLRRFKSGNSHQIFFRMTTVRYHKRLYLIRIIFFVFHLIKVLNTLTAPADVKET